MPASPAAAAPAAPAVPDKFLVKGQDGAIDHSATALKVAEAYSNLERRLGSGEAPPASVEGYKINVPEALADRLKADDLAASGAFKEFLGKAHAAGLNQHQLDVVVGNFLERSMALQEAKPAMAAAECESSLRGLDGWKSDAEYSQQIGTAWRAGKSIFGQDFDGILQDYGNDPRLIKGLASIGREMAEDLPPSAEAQAQMQEGLDGLMNSRAYLDSNDPQHAATVARVDALTKQLAGTRPVAGGKSSTFRSG